MKTGRIMLGILGFWFLLSGGTVYADDPVIPSAPLNDPSETVSLVKRIVNHLNPSYESVIDVYNGDTYQGISASLFNFTHDEVPLGSLRIGASTGMAIYGGLGLNVKGVATKFLPQVLKDVASPGPMETVWGILGKYSCASLIAGYSWDHRDPVVGATAGACVSL